MIDKRWFFQGSDASKATKGKNSWPFGFLLVALLSIFVVQPALAQGTSLAMVPKAATPETDPVAEANLKSSSSVAGAVPKGMTAAKSVQVFPAKGVVDPANAAGETLAGAAAPTRTAAPVVPELPTEFQQFVEQSTGRLLPIYGTKVFETGAFDSVQAAQVPDSYIVGPGDELVVRVYGAFDYAERLVVDRDGRVTLPKVGPIKVAGLRFAQLEAALSRTVGDVYKNFKLSVSMGRLRSIEVYLLGQARQPGRKVVSSLSTLINALFEAGGPSVRGSLRGIELRRAGKVVTRLDLYDFIARGDNQADRPLEPGDIIFIPPVGPQVAILGSVNESAIFELAGTTPTSLQSVLALTGGVTALATPQKAQLERINPQQNPARRVQTIALDAQGIATALQAGDVVTVYPISPQFANAVTLQGSVAMPMRLAHREGMRVSDLVMNNNFLVPVSYWLRLNAGTLITGIDKPEVNLEYATVQRLDPVRLRTETISFHLAKALMGDTTENLALKPGDLVRVYGANEVAQDALDSVTLEAGFLVSQGVRRSVWREGYHVKDIIPDVRWLQDEVVRKARNTGVAVSIDDLNSRTNLSGDLSTGKLSASELQEVNLEYADIRRLDPLTLEVKLLTFNLSKALAGDAAHNLALQRGDRISLYSKREVPVPIERRTRLVKLLGEVVTPGTYQVNPGETLNDMVRRAGGFTSQAYAYGARFTRESTRLEQKKNLAAYIQNLEADLISQRSASLQNQAAQDAQKQETLLAIQRQSIERLRKAEVSGRIALDLDENVLHPVLPSLALEDGDTLDVPSHSDFVTVVGAVDLSNAMIYRPGLTVRDYLERAGLKAFADLDSIAVLKADGTVKTRRTVAGRLSLLGWRTDESLLNQPLRPGDAILVPEKLDRQSGYTTFVTAAKDWTQLIYQLGLGIAAFKSLN
jgi:polysaccharide export outer membrane protein